MNGDYVIEKAVELLGYDNNARYQFKSLSALNSIYSDLFYLNNDEGFKPLTTTGDEIALTEKIINDVMPYGVASMIALSMGDSDNQQIFSQIYNLKRKRAKTKGTIEDVLPSIEEG